SARPAHAPHGQSFDLPPRAGDDAAPPAGRPAGLDRPGGVLRRTSEKSMNSKSEGASPRHSPGSGWMIALTLTISVLAVAVWYGWRSFAASKVAEISVEDYLRIKSSLDDVRIEGNDLYGEVSKGAFVVNGKAYKRVHLIIPAAYLTNPEGLEELKSGVEPSRFHMSPGR